MRNRAFLCCGAAAWFFLINPTVVSAIPSAKVQFNLESQQLLDAVTAWAKQAGIQIIWPPDSVALSSRMTRKISGFFSPDEALSMLLAGTGLTYSLVDEQTVAIQSAKTSAGNDGGKIPIALANVEETRHASNSTQMQKVDADGDHKKSDSKSDLKSEIGDEVVVIGSHMRGVENRTVPVTILDREYIDATGLTTTARLVETLPQNFAQVNQSGYQVPGATGNSWQGSSVTLRGLGQGTTLTLLNGRRMAPGFNSLSADISSLPLSAIDRVEILPDGASALYGSDAVGGVVNFVLRDDFDGAETRVSAGWADPQKEYRVSQAFGQRWDSGNALISAEFYTREMLLAKDRSFVPSTVTAGSLLPEEKNIASILSVRQQLADNVRLFLDGLFTKRDSENRGGRHISLPGFELNEDADVDNTQSGATLGVDWQLGGNWQLSASGSHARNDMELLLHAFGIQGDQLFEIKSAQLRADGPLVQLPGGKISLAVGAEWRDERFDAVTSIPLEAPTVSSKQQSVRSAFAQLYIPIIGAGNAMKGIRSLELSLAGRMDDYSTFGSSVDPQYGLAWEPLSGLRLRGSIGSSYKPPNLVDYDYGGAAAQAGAGRFVLTGTDVSSLGPQESDSTSFGLEWGPTFIPGLQVGFNYFDIEYSGRIESPGRSATTVLNNPAAFSSVITNNPTPMQLSEGVDFARRGLGLYVDGVLCAVGCVLDPSSVNVIVDLRRRNLSLTGTRGFDVSVHQSFDIFGGQMRVGADGTHIKQLVQRVTDTSAGIDRVDTIFNPPDWRVRGSIGWQFEAWSTNMFINYVDSYLDNRGPNMMRVRSLTTIDSNVSYAFSNGGGLFSGFKVAVSIQNLMDRDPPQVAVLNPFDYELGFDSTNASPLGRFISFEVSKTW